MLLQAQGIYSVRIKVIDEDSRREVPNLGINLEENGQGLGTGTTDGNGIATITIPRTTRTLKLVLSSREIEIVSPIGGETHAPSPEIDNPLIEFYVKTSQFRMMALQIEQLSREKKQLEDLSNSLQKRLSTDQSIYKDSLEMIKGRIAKLMVEIDDKKSNIFSAISDNYLQFLNAILDMERMLGNVSPIFTQEGALRNFNRQIETLNLARNSMHENHLAYIQVVGQHWDKKTADKLMGLYTQALENTYGNTLLPLNDDFIAYLKASWNGDKPRLSVQRKAKKNTEKALPKLHEEITIMEVLGKEVLAVLDSDALN
ncbi:MAG: hypothetical protein WD398_09055 [Cyclobacteriaceae bacterium]